MILQIAAQHLVGGGAAKLEGGRRRHRARVGGEKVAAGRQHVAAAARGRARRAGGYMAAVERGDQRLALAGSTCAAQRIGLGTGHAAIDVQAILYREILEIAEPGVDALQGGVRRFVARHASFGGKPGFLSLRDDQLRQTVAAAAVEPIGLHIFVDQPLEHLLVLIEPGPGERWRQVAERDGGDAALGLRRLARIADDERIDDRQRAGDDFGKTVAGERHRLAWQPFQRAVGADMHDGVATQRFLQPQAEGDQRMTRWDRRVVIVGAAVGGTPPVRRQRHRDVAEAGGAEGEILRGG